MKTNGNETVVDIDLKEIIIELWSKKWLIAVVAVICAIITWGFTQMRNVPMYESTGSIMILNQKEEAGNSTQLSISTKLTDDYEKVIVSRNIVNQVITNLNLDVTYEELRGCISTDVESDSRVITIHVISASPQLAKQIVDEIQKLSTEYIKNNLEVHAAVILDEGNQPNGPLRNNSVKIAIVAFCAGIILTAFVIIIFYVMDDTIRTEKDVEYYLKLPLLGEVSQKNVKPEEYEVLRTNIKVKNKNTKSIVVTKSLEKEQISDLAYQLAASFAKGSEKVLYVDADLRESHENNQIGLVDVLSGSVSWKEAVKKAENNQLYILNVGTGCHTPSEMLDSDAFDILLSQLKEEYSYIVMNTSSLIDYIDAAIVASKCDGVILAIECGKTDFTYAKKVVKQLEYVGASVIGSVISNK